MSNDRLGEQETGCPSHEEVMVHFQGDEDRLNPNPKLAKAWCIGEWRSGMVQKVEALEALVKEAYLEGAGRMQYDTDKRWKDSDVKRKLEAGR